MRVGFVIVSGPPGSGKSTLATELAARLALPLFMKDTVKEVLADVLGAPDVDASKRLGHAASVALVGLARVNGRGILESNWRASTSLRSLRRLEGPVVEVFCECDPAVSRTRYEARASGRHAVHFDHTRAQQGDLWSGDALQPVDGGWPVLRVDTTRAVDVDRLCDAIRSAA